jgi:hypothetical protein
MIKQVQLYAGGSLGFAFAVVWATLGLRTALACLFATGVGAGLVLYAQHRSSLRIAGRVSEMRTRVESLAVSARKVAEPKPKPKPMPKARTSERRIAGYPVTKQVQETTYGW